MAAQQAGLFDYDAELYRYHQHLQAALSVRASDHVLDIGCGTGQTTRSAAKAAVSGAALGVDLSAAMLTRARRASREQGLTNVRFLRADAQTHHFLPEAFDLGVSRFGTMFFTDPAAAFTNIARALRPGAQLVQLVWQHSDRQEWTEVIRHVFGHDPAPAPGADPFSLADPTTVNAIMTAAGFTNVDVFSVREPVYYGNGTESALDAMLTLRTTKDLLAPLDASHAATTLDQLRTALAARRSSGGVFFDSCAWLITAHRGLINGLPARTPGRTDSFLPVRASYHQTTNTGRFEEEAMTVSMHDADTRGPRPVHGASRTKAKGRALWVVRAALALGLISAGSQKLAGSPQMVHMFSQIGAGQWLRYLVGSLEIAGAIGLLIGRFAAAAAAGVTALMIGAMITNIFVIHMSPALPLVFLAAAAAVVWDRRRELKALLRLA